MTEDDRILYFFKPRHTHTWNMLCLACKQLKKSNPSEGFEVEYAWENFLLRLWIYRSTILALMKVESLNSDIQDEISTFDQIFSRKDINGKTFNALIGFRNMVIHFEDYAAGLGRGPAVSDRDLDPWRSSTPEEYERELLTFSLPESIDAADQLRRTTKKLVSNYWSKMT